MRNPRARRRYVEQPELEEAETRWQVPVEFGEHGRGAGAEECAAPLVIAKLGTHELDSLVVMAVSGPDKFNNLR